MRKRALALAVVAGAAAVAVGAAARRRTRRVQATASSHREAPAIANDPTADITDFYMFRSPDGTDSVTMLMNVIPFELPPEGPNYYNLDDSARYRFHVDWDGNGKPEVSYRPHQDEGANGNTFLYATGAVDSLNDPDLNVTQTWTLYERRGKDGSGHMRKIGTGTTAPNYVGNARVRLAGTVQRGRQLGRAVARRRRQGVHRPARGPVLHRRRPHLRPALRGRQGHRQRGGRQRPHDRPADPAEQDPQVGLPARHRRLHHGRSHEDRVAQGGPEVRQGAASGSRSSASASRSSTRC